MGAYQQRVVEEKAELDGRIERLLAFAKSEAINDVPSDEAFRLGNQVYYMQGYSRVLGERIEAFPTDVGSQSQI